MGARVSRRLRRAASEPRARDEGPYSAQSARRSRGELVGARPRETPGEVHVLHPGRAADHRRGSERERIPREGARGPRRKREVRGENARSPPFGERRYGVGVALDRPGERPRGGRETGTKTHSVSSVSDGGGGEAEAFGCGRRGGGDGDGARVFREGRRRGRRRGGRGRGRTRRGGGGGRTGLEVGGGCGGAGAGGVGRARGGSARGTERRFRRKVASEDEDA